MIGSSYLDPSWLEVLQDQFSSPYFSAIEEGLLAKREAGEIIYPPA